MSVVQITLDYLDELKRLDPDVEFSVTVYSTKIKIEEEDLRNEQIGAHGEFAWTLGNNAMFLHLRNEQKSIPREASSSAL